MKRKTKSFLISFLLLFAMLLGVSAFNTNTAKAEETPTLYNLTVSEGVANVDDVAVAQATEGTLVTIVANEKENHRFECWQIVAGENVILEDATAMQTTFYMPACDVEITAVYESLVLSEIRFTMTTPMHGEYFDNSATALEPDLYTVEISEIKIEPVGVYLSIATPFDTSTPYEAGNYYYFSFNFTLHDGRVMDNNTKIYINDQELWYSSSYGHYIRYETLFPITVIGGESYADDGFTAPITHIRKNGTFYVKAEQTKEDLVFKSWEIEGKPSETGDVMYHMLRIKQGEELLVVTATYSKKHKITVVGGKASMTEAVAGRTPRLTLTYVPEGALFSHWALNGERLELNNDNRFVMPDEEAFIEAIYHYHTYGDTLTFDENQHWNQCIDENCLDLEHSIKDKTKHNFDHNCDPTCNDNCAYERTTTHVFIEEWATDTYQHWHPCFSIGCEEFEEKFDHEFVDGVCSTCNHECSHYGGKATCSTLAVCSLCAMPYGDFDTTNHEDGSSFVINAHTHVKAFDCCGGFDGEEANHTFEDGACVECKLSQANVIDTVTVNGIFAPYISQNVSYYINAIENAILNGEITINGATYDSLTQTIGNIRLIDVKVVKSTGEAVDTVAFRKDSYNLQLTLAPIDGYYFFNELSINVTFDGENAASIEKAEEELSIYSPAFDITSNVIDKLVFEGVTPPLGMTVADYYEYARSITINGSSDEDSIAVYGEFSLVAGYLADNNKNPLDEDFVITEGTYYFYFAIEVDRSFYKFASRENLVITFDGTDDITFYLYTDEIEIYAKYELKHTCVNADTDEHTCDICGEIVTPCEDTNPADHICDICGETANDCIDEDTNHVCDVCGETGMGAHEQAEGKHTCDYCGETISDCEDEDKNHACDVCGETLGTHENAEGKHTCDYCGETVNACKDEDTNHVCDICGETLSEHKDANNDGSCDYCGNKTSSDVEPTDSSSQETITGCQAGYTGSVAGNGMTLITLLGLSAIVLLRKKR